MTKHYSIEGAQIQAISSKAEALKQWLAENAPGCAISQMHLEQGTAEQAYWHYGYFCALRDILTIIDSESSE